MNKITRDDTEHGVEYVRAAEAQAEVAVQSLQCAHCHVTIETLNDKVVYLIAEVERLRAIEEAAKNLVKVKGRHHTEQAFNKLKELVQ
jgi:hypothetical protein